MPAPSSPDRVPVVERASVLARRWIAEAAAAGAGRSERRVAAALRDEDSLALTRRLLDGVLRPEGVLAGAAQLRRASADIPEGLPWYLRGLVRAGGGIATALPSPTVPIARRALREVVDPVVTDARPTKLARSLAQAAATGSRVRVAVIGEAVLGDGAARCRGDELEALIRRDDVDEVSVSLDALVGPRDPWSFDAMVDAAADALAQLLLLALAHGTTLTLDVDGHADLDLAVATFTRTLEEPNLRSCEAGIGLPASLSEALPALRELMAWADARVAHGGAPVLVRLVGGPPAAGDRALEWLHGWERAAYDVRADIDANLVRMLDEALDGEHAVAVRIALATNDLFLIAYACVLADEREAADALTIEVPWGLSEAQILALRSDVGHLLLSIPVAQPDELDAATEPLLRRLGEVAAMQAVFGVGADTSGGEDLLDAERDRILAAVRSALRPPGRVLARTQDRGAPVHESARPAPAAPVQDAGLTDIVLGISRGSEADALLETAVYARLETDPDAGGAAGFENTAATDPTRTANREWMRAIRGRIEVSTLGVEGAAASAVTDRDRLDEIVVGVRAAAVGWGSRPATDRADALQRAAASLQATRADLIEVAAHEAGVLPADADADVDRAVDLARYYAATARELDAVPGAVFEPDRVTVVMPSSSTPVAAAAEGVLAALAAGSGVILTPPSAVKRCAAVLAETLWGSGIPRDVVALVDVDGDGHADADGLREALVRHRDVDRLLSTGTGDAKNAIIVAPSADVDLAVADIVRSGFGRAGQDRLAASVVILVGAMGRSRRFARQLADATRSLRVGRPHEERVDVGPLVTPPEGALEWALTELEGEERWIVRPGRVAGDETGRLWTPGIRAGVLPGARMHQEAFSGPVIAVMHASTLAAAIEIQNALPSGLAAGLHTRDAGDLAVWLDGVEAGTLWVNRATVDPVVQRHPVGGWKTSSVGTGMAAGGPNRLVALGSWRASTGGGVSSTLHLRGLDSRITDLIESAQPSLDFARFEWLRQAALSDAVAWGREFGKVRDVSQLGVERDLLRYRPVPVMIRATEGAGLQELLRVIVAAIRSGARFVVSTPAGVPAEVRRTLTAQGAVVAVEDDDEWLERMRAQGHTAAADIAAVPDEDTDSLGARPRVRLLGAKDAVAELRARLVAAVGEDVAIHDGGVTSAGRIELLTFLHEQSIAITAHRFGVVDEWSATAI